MEPDRIIPVDGKVLEDLLEASRDEERRVLDDDVPGPELANEAGVLSPKTAARIVEATSFACRRHADARKPSAEDVDGLNFSSIQGPHVVVLGHAGPVAPQVAAGLGIDLALPGRVA
jgi:hypothetical protein